MFLPYIVSFICSALGSRTLDSSPLTKAHILRRRLSDAAAPQAQANQGIVRGIHLNEDVSAFLGVPYAQPPVDNLRFKPPQPLLQSSLNTSKVLDATAFGPVCWQVHYESFLGSNIIETTPQSEDCLTLNIFTPRKYFGTKPLPILLWIYGGSFSEGGGSMPGMNFLIELQKF